MEVMVVDDETDIQLLFEQKFRKEIKQGKIQFHFVFSAEEALDFLKNQQMPEGLVLILADINMPGMNGLDLLKVIKHDFAEIKVFMVTAYSDLVNYKTALEYGADDYINKPIEFEKLKQKIWKL
jgi:CheY-like chemotaxis protein